MLELLVIFDKNENNLILKATKMKNPDSAAWVTWLYIQIWIRFTLALMKYAIYSNIYRYIFLLTAIVQSLQRSSRMNWK